MEPHALSCIVSLIRQKPVFECVVVELDSMMKRSTLLVKVGRFGSVRLGWIVLRFW